MSPSSTWGQAASPLDSGETPVSVLLAGELGARLTGWQQAITLDARFRMAALANDPSDLQSKLAYNPEVVLLDAMLFRSPQELTPALTSISAAVHVILPASVGASGDPEIKSLPESLKQLSSVKGVYVGDPSIPDLLQRIYADALALRRKGGIPSSWNARAQAAAPVSGLRVAAIWSRSGGVGRTTIAAALGMSVARRGVRTLLVGLDAPDRLPLHLGLKPAPNIQAWFATPVMTSIEQAVQKAGELDLLAGFPDIQAEDDAYRSDEKNGLSVLTNTASFGGYTAILLDTPAASRIATAAIQAANTWILVARPTLADAWAAVDALRTVTQRIAGQHRIPPGNIFVALNMRAGGMLSPDEWHQSADAACRKLGMQTGFPPLAAVIPYVPEIPLAQDAARPALDSSDEFARPIHGLAEALFGGLPSTDRKKGGGRKFSLGGLTLKVKD